MGVCFHARFVLPHHFLSTNLDASLLLEAYLYKEAFLRPYRAELSCMSGLNFVYQYCASCHRERDARKDWTIVDSDGVFTISANSSGLMRKMVDYSFGGDFFGLESYYKPWDTVNGRLQTPTLSRIFQTTRLRGGLAIQKGLPTSLMEELRRNMKASNQSNFKALVAHLIFSTIDEKYHRDLLPRVPNLFPLIPSDPSYWWKLSALPIFVGKTPRELKYQTVALLNTHLQLCSGIPQHSRLLRDFLPLQNLSLYFKAFGVEERPLRAFQPLEHAKLASALKESGLFSHNVAFEPQWIEYSDRCIRQALRIDCDRTMLESSPVFIPVLRLMSDANQEAVWMGALVIKPPESGRFTYSISERLCARFPHFQNSRYHYLVLLHQCHHSSDDENVTILENWIDTKEGKDTILRLLNDFQMPLAPEVLALIIVNMLSLWTLTPSAEIEGSQLLPSNLSGLQELLFQPDALKESYDLLQDLVVSFSRTFKKNGIQLSDPVIEILQAAHSLPGTTTSSEEFDGYFRKRLARASHHHAASFMTANIEILLDGFVLI